MNGSAVPVILGLAIIALATAAACLLLSIPLVDGDLPPTTTRAIAEQPTLLPPAVDAVTAYHTFVEHTVTFVFDFDSPGDVVRTTDGQWARLTGVTIHLYDNREPRVWAGGQRCRKDGERDRRMGNVGVSVELPDSDVWIERARQAVTTQVDTAAPSEEPT